MANLPEQPQFEEGIYQIELTDPVVGGIEGISNRQARQLGNRTQWLKAAIEQILKGGHTVAKASRLATARKFLFKGAATGEATFDGSENAVIDLTLADSGAKPGTYAVVTLNAKGLASAGRALQAEDVPGLPWGKITSGKPTTLAGYGITDAVPSSAFTWSGLPGKPSLFPPAAHGHPWSSISATPTTLAGYGITDAVPSGAFTWSGLSGKPSLFPPAAHGHAWSSISATPTTLTGYGITDAPELVRTTGWRTLGAAEPKLEGGDFNYITTPGCYSVLMHGSNKNGPGGGYYYVQVFEYAGTNLTQLLIPYMRGDSLAYRHRYNGTWSAYSKVVDTANYHHFSGMPGQVAAFAQSAPPLGWLKANGAAISRTSYPALFAVLGTYYGAGDGYSTFNLPDLRGEFIRGWDDSRGLDAGRVFGSIQNHMLGYHDHTASAAAAGSHQHAATCYVAGGHSHTLGRANNSGALTNTPFPGHNETGAFTTSTDGAHNHSITVWAGGDHSHAIYVGATGGHETRPRNVALLHCIKY